MEREESGPVCEALLSAQPRTLIWREGGVGDKHRAQRAGLPPTLDIWLMALPHTGCAWLQQSPPCVPPVPPAAQTTWGGPMRLTTQKSAPLEAKTR